MTQKLFTFLFLIVLFTLPAAAQVSIPNSMTASPVSAPIHFDGSLDEEAWEKAEKITNFTQRELNFGEPVTERTEVAVLFDETNIYIGVWCFDREPDKIIAKEMKRDFNDNLDDNFKIILDTYNDKRNGFMFVINPNGARGDYQVFNNGGSTNIFWNGVWDVRTKTTAQGWFAEVKIPFSTLKFRTGVKNQVWGINFERNIRRKREQALWQGWSRDNNLERVNQSGSIGGFGALESGRFIELKPYGIGGGENTSSEGNSGLANAGGDVNYLLSPTYRLNVTLNTDFAQVEDDRQQVNLTRFPLFFPELREFFLQGDDYFDFGFGGNRIVPFYSRRIGLDSNFQTVPMIGGARILGKEDNSTVGAMSIQTAETESQPMTNYSVASWRQDIGEQSIIGAMTVNKVSEGRWHSTTGINGRFSTAKLFGDKNFNMGGAFIQNYNSDESFQSSAHAWRVFAQYPNDFFSVFTSAQRSPEDFEPEVGLMRRRNFRETFFSAHIKPRPKNNLKWIRQFDFIPIQITNTNWDDTGELQSFDYAFQFIGFDTKSGESFSMRYSVIAEGLRQDFAIADDVIIESGEYWWREWQTSFSTFAGRTFSVRGNLTLGEFYNGSATRTNGTLVWRAGKHININAIVELNRVNLPEGSFNRDLYSSRIEYAISPYVFGSLLTQWNNQQDIINLNFRLQMIPKVGTDFFFIINQAYDTQLNRVDLQRTTIIGKLIWRFVV